MSGLSRGASAPSVASDFVAQAVELSALVMERCDSLCGLFAAIERLAGINDPAIAALAGLGGDLARDTLKRCDGAHQAWEEWGEKVE